MHSPKLIMRKHPQIQPEKYSMTYISLYSSKMLTQWKRKPKTLFRMKGDWRDMTTKCSWQSWCKSYGGNAVCVWKSLSHVQLFATPWTPARQASLSITKSQSLLKLVSIELVMSSKHFILCRPLLLPPSVFPSIKVFSSESVLCIRWPKYQSFISPSNEYAGLISFRIDWFDFLAFQVTLKSLLPPHSSKASILWRSAFFMVQISHSYMTSEKNIALTRWTFVGKIMSLLFNMLSRFVIGFLPRTKCLLIPWLQLPSAVVLEPKKIKSVTVSIVPHLFAVKWWDQMPWSYFFECWILSQPFHSPLSL